MRRPAILWHAMERAAHARAVATAKGRRIARGQPNTASAAAALRTID